MDVGPYFYMNSFDPLVCTSAGRAAADRHKIPPYVDGSIRREPDFEHPFPAITCLCRTDRFAPRLRVGDVVAYRTNKGRYGSSKPHRRLIAVLRVTHLLDSHQEGAEWYRERNLPLPNNCMVRGNEAKPFDQSHQRRRKTGCASNAQLHRDWDLAYHLRARSFPRFVVCEALFVDLFPNAPALDDDLLIRVFGCIPGSRNPGRRTMDELHALMSELRILIPRAAK